MNKQILIDDVNAFAEIFELSESLHNKTFLITGATGLIGSVMIKCLLALNRKYALGIKVIAVVRDLDKAKTVFADEFAEIEFRKLNLNDITLSVIGADVDYIVHLASPTASKYFVEHPVETLRTALEGTTAVLEYAKNADIMGMVYASSLEVYGSNDTDEWLDENFQGYVNPVEVRSSYNIGKRAAESLCHSYSKEYHVPVKIARLTQTIGAGISKDDNRIMAQFTRLASQGHDIILRTEGTSSRPYCYTTDCISGILYILLKGISGEAYNVANEETYISAKGLADFIHEFFCPEIKVIIEIGDNSQYAPVTKQRLSSEKLRNLGWIPNYDLKDIISRLLKCYSV